MIKLYLPENRQNSKVKGLWYNSKSRRIDFDSIRIEARQGLSVNSLDRLKRLYRQEAIFYIDRGKAFIYYNRAKIEALRHCNRAIVKRGNFRQLRAKIKEFISTFGGLTIYRQKNQYTIEAWQ